MNVIWGREIISLVKEEKTGFPLDTEGARGNDKDEAYFVSWCLRGEKICESVAIISVFRARDSSRQWAGKLPSFRICTFEKYLLMLIFV
jgi:hypothetical protein